jgi:hypothetical protein
VPAVKALGQRSTFGRAILASRLRSVLASGQYSRNHEAARRPCNFDHHARKPDRLYFAQAREQITLVLSFPATFEDRARYSA